MAKEYDITKPFEHWTPWVKAAVVERFRAGEITARQLEDLHGITADELAHWCDNFAAVGLGGLKSSLVPVVRRVPL
jgi:hypothetical protein